VQISSLQSSQSLKIRLRTCPGRVSHAAWHRHSMSTKKVRRILGQVTPRCVLPVVQLDQVVIDTGLRPSAGDAGAAAHVGALHLQINPDESFYRNGK
jgi:hypothetical protein